MQCKRISANEQTVSTGSSSKGKIIIKQEGILRSCSVKIDIKESRLSWGWHGCMHLLYRRGGAIWLDDSGSSSKCAAVGAMSSSSDLTLSHGKHAWSGKENVKKQANAQKSGKEFQRELWEDCPKPVLRWLSLEMKPPSGSSEAGSLEILLKI
ncbi:hypothetical protein NC653_037769 [Populus alba x Populus x berolinensis]|uniref:Uncharacterized protein n=1 Tax=Populus alba x Populus x berolinensis TaxID=444605 RepID=A0AAD6LHS1_9ROSI|nr:hypothetical protein NC653_037769 [Populus alba x Populus x berolinensis]